MTTHTGGSAAHNIVATFAGAPGPGAWRLDRAAVAERLHRLVDSPDLIRQGGLNLCGPAALFQVWLRGDPVAAVTYAVRLFEEGEARLGAVSVSASAGLRRHAYLERRCPSADWMMMAALRDSSNRFVRYTRPGGLREAVAAITMPGALRRWLAGIGLFATVRDETSLMLRKGFRHASQLPVGAGREVVALVAQEMFRTPTSPLPRARDFVASLVPNHWVILTAPVTRVGDGRVRLRFWSWGAQYVAEVAESRFRRCYYGALVALSA